MSPDGWPDPDKEAKDARLPLKCSQTLPILTYPYLSISLSNQSRTSELFYKESRDQFQEFPTLLTY